MKKKLEKLTAFAWTSALLFAGMLLAHWLPAIQGLYTTYAGALVGLATAFFAAHVSAGWVDTKTTSSSSSPSQGTAEPAQLPSK